MDEEPSTEAGDNQFDLALDYVNKIKVFFDFLDFFQQFLNFSVDLQTTQRSTRSSSTSFTDTRVPSSILRLASNIF